MIVPYLTFPGSTEMAFSFYKSVFGGEFTVLFRYQDLDENTAEGQKIAHIVLKTPSNIILMGSDETDPMDKKLSFGNNFQLSVQADTPEEAESILARLAADGKITMPFTTMPWDMQIGKAKDQFGIHWIVSVGQNSI